MGCFPIGVSTGGGGCSGPSGAPPMTFDAFSPITPINTNRDEPPPDSGLRLNTSPQDACRLVKEGSVTRNRGADTPAQYALETAAITADGGPFALLGPPAEPYLGHTTVRCKGRIVLGPDSSTALGTLAMIWVPTILFFAIMSPRMPFYWSIIDAVLVVAATICLFQTSTTDPGILRRNQVPPNESEVPMQVMVRVGGELVEYRYCRTCFIFRNPRASHCHVCDNCVERFDHHCPWTGTCIGLHNYRFFCRFLLSVILLAIYDIICSTLVVVFKFQELGGQGLDQYWEAAKSFYLIPLVLGVYCAIILVTVGPLCGFHLYLIATGQTTREAFKDNANQNSDRYSKGLLRNCSETCCDQTSPYPQTFATPQCEPALEMQSVGHPPLEYV